MIASSADYTPGFYGKLPVQGDFVSRRLPASFIQPWDTWLRTAMAASKESLGEAWQNAYLASPKWRFILSPDICDQNCWAGVFLPSVDKVGRYFPLTLAMSIDKPALLLRFFVFGAEWFERLEQLADTAFENRFSMEEFDEQLAMQSIASLTSAREQTFFKNDHLNDTTNGWHFEMEDLKQMPEVCVQLSERLLSAYLPEYTLWCTGGSGNVSPSFRLYAGLPPIDVYTELLSKYLINGQSHVSVENNIIATVPDFRELEDTRPEAQTIIDSQIYWTSGACTTVGAVREVNQDAFLDCPEIGLWAVADGMGGHSAGEVASRTAVQALAGLSASNDIEVFVKMVTECLQQVNTELIDKAAGPDPEQIIGSTVVVMLAVGNRCAAIWAGDSRLYRYRNGALKQLTYDHTQPVKVSISDFFSDETPTASSHNNAISKALGAVQDLQVDVSYFESRIDDLYLLCSDGLIKEVSLKEIAEVLSRGKHIDTARELVDLSLERGARDNVTVIVIKSESKISEII